MNKAWVICVVLGCGISASSIAGNVDGGAVVGGAIGGGTGAAIGSSVGGKDGAIIGGAIGGAAGAAIGSSSDKSAKTETIVVRETVVVQPAGGPPGHSRGKKKGWKKH